MPSPVRVFVCSLSFPIACGKYGATKRERAVQTKGGGREAEAHLEAQTIRVKGGAASNLVLRRRHWALRHSKTNAESREGPIFLWENGEKILAFDLFTSSEKCILMATYV